MFTNNRKSQVFRFALVIVLLSVIMGVKPIRPVYAAPLVVTNMDDSGAGSLRQAIADAVSGDTITFDSSLAGQTITLASTLIVDKDLTIDGSALASKIGISGNNSVSIFEIDSGSTVLFDSLIIKNGYAAIYGGGVYNAGTLTVVNSVFSENTVPNSFVIGPSGGAIYGGTLTITGSVFNNNSAPEGGAIRCGGPMTVINSSFSSNQATYGVGGAIHNACNFTSTISNTTFSANTAAGNGGAILTDSNSATLAITNSTFYDNTASSGGGIANYGGLIVTNSTFSNNNASSGGAIRNGIGGILSLRNSILANSVGSVDCIKADSVPAIENIKNLIETTGTALESCGVPYLSSDPMLGPLADHGGFTQTMMLLPGSPAVNMGNNTNCPVTDQRGVARPQGSRCDIGAVELEATFTVSPFTSSDIYDGWILEFAETSGAGGTMNATTSLLRLGDDSANRQYRAILSFDTSSLPNTAIIAFVTLRFKYASETGTLPFGATHGYLFADVQKGAFSSNKELQLGDFSATGSLSTYKAKALNYTGSKLSNWYSRSLLPANFHYINLSGVTQFRLRFAKDDNNDFSADFLKIYSGNATDAAKRPQLIIEYYVP